MIRSLLRISKCFVISLAFINCLNISSRGQAGTWTWMKGSDWFNGSGEYGIQGVPDDDNTPPNLYGPAVWTDHNGKFWLFGGLSNFSVYNSMWQYDPMTNSWTWIHGPSTYGGQAEYGTLGIPSPDNIPGSRAYGCLTWVDNSNDLWLYGGYGIDDVGGYGVMADLWKYSIATNEWTWISGPTTNGHAAIYGTILVSDPNNTPGSRWETTANWTDADGNLWLFGGWDHNSFPRGDLWKYDVSTGEWTWMSGSSAVYASASYGVLGIPSPTNQPGARNTYSAFKDSNGNFWMFGGIKTTLSEFRNDLWKFDPVTLEWTWMSGSNLVNSDGDAGAVCEADESFAPRSRGENRACWTDECGNMWVFGGSYYLNDYNDLWVYRIDSNDWTFVSGDLSAGVFGAYGTQGVPDPANKPGARDGATSWIDTSGNLWLFGGYGLYGIHNDLWRFIPDSDCPGNFCNTVSLLPSSSFSASDSTVCEKFCIDFTDLSTNSPTTWQWSFPGGIPANSAQQNPDNICYNVSGEFDVQLITCNQFGCDTLDLPDFVTVFSTPPFPAITVNGNLLTSSPAAAYQWQLNSVDIAGATNQTYTATVSGFYTVIITDENGCQNSMSIDVVFTGVSVSQSDQIISVYPNPSDGSFTIEMMNVWNEKIKIEIFNALGELVYTVNEEMKGGKLVKVISLQSPGIYSVNLSAAENTLMQKIIVVK